MTIINKKQQELKIDESSIRYMVAVRMMALGIGSVLLLSTLNIANATPSSNLTIFGPSQQSIPKIDFDDPTKSVVVQPNFLSLTDVVFGSANVSTNRPYTRVGDPPLLRIELFDYKGRQLEILNAWHPLWTLEIVPDEDKPGGNETRRILENASGIFVIPFNPKLWSMKVYDIPLAQELISRFDENNQCFLQGKS